MAYDDSDTVVPNTNVIPTPSSLSIFLYREPSVIISCIFSPNLPASSRKIPQLYSFAAITPSDGRLNSLHTSSNSIQASLRTIRDYASP